MAGSGFIALMIFIFVVVIPCFVYGLLWGTNTLCDKTNPDPQRWTGMNCASVYEMSGGSPSTDPCASYTPTSLAKDITPQCLQKLFTDAGCTTEGTVYPSDTYKGWWNSSPGGLSTAVYCSGSQVPGDGAGDCGAGNYGVTMADIKLYGTQTDTVHKTACLGLTAGDPRKPVWDLGQKIQSDPIDSQYGAPFATSPTGYSGTPSYTMSLDINIEKTAAGWRGILSHASMAAGAQDGGTDGRRPSVLVSGNSFPPANRIHIIHQTAAGRDNTSIITTFAATPGTYFNLTWVVSGGVLKTYINGTLDATGTVSGAFGWPTPDNPWTWSHPVYQLARNGQITVANVYFWNTPLTDAQIAQLKIPATPISGVPTTSYYAPEPYEYSKGVTGY